METVERCDNGYIRVVHGEITSGGHQLCIHLAGPDDQTPAVRRSAYKPECSWCWLGANHSEAAHDA